MFLYSSKFFESLVHSRHYGAGDGHTVVSRGLGVSASPELVSLRGGAHGFPWGD